MNLETKWVCFVKITRGRKYRATVPLSVAFLSPILYDGSWDVGMTDVLACGRTKNINSISHTWTRDTLQTCVFLLCTVCRLYSHCLTHVMVFKPYKGLPCYKCWKNCQTRIWFYLRRVWYFTTVYGNLTMLRDLLQIEKAKLPYPWDKFKICEGFLTNTATLDIYRGAGQRAIHCEVI